MKQIYIIFSDKKTAELNDEELNQFVKS